MATPSSAPHQCSLQADLDPLLALLELPMGQLERLVGGRFALEFVRHDC